MDEHISILHVQAWLAGFGFPSQMGGEPDRMMSLAVHDTSFQRTYHETQPFFVEWKWVKSQSKTSKTVQVKVPKPEDVGIKLSHMRRM